MALHGNYHPKCPLISQLPFSAFHLLLFSASRSLPRACVVLSSPAPPRVTKLQPWCLSQLSPPAAFPSSGKGRLSWCSIGTSPLHRKQSKSLWSHWVNDSILNPLRNPEEASTSHNSQTQLLTPNNSSSSSWGTAGVTWLLAGSTRSSAEPEPGASLAQRKVCDESLEKRRLWGDLRAPSSA